MMPSVKYMHVQRRLPLVKATCKRCAESFVYYRRGRPRWFCEPCGPLVRQDHNTFYNGRAREERLAARKNAVQAHLSYARSDLRVVERVGFLNAGDGA